MKQLYVLLVITFSLFPLSVFSEGTENVSEAITLTINETNLIPHDGEAYKLSFRTAGFDVLALTSGNSILGPNWHGDDLILGVQIGRFINRKKAFFHTEGNRAQIINFIYRTPINETEYMEYKYLESSMANGTANLLGKNHLRQRVAFNAELAGLVSCRKNFIYDAELDRYVYDAAESAGTLISDSEALTLTGVIDERKF